MVGDYKFHHPPHWPVPPRQVEIAPEGLIRSCIDHHNFCAGTCMRVWQLVKVHDNITSLPRGQEQRGTVLVHRDSSRPIRPEALFGTNDVHGELPIGFSIQIDALAIVHKCQVEYAGIGPVQDTEAVAFPPNSQIRPRFAVDHHHVEENLGVPSRGEGSFAVAGLKVAIIPKGGPVAEALEVGAIRGVEEPAVLVERFGSDHQGNFPYAFSHRVAFRVQIAQRIAFPRGRTRKTASLQARLRTIAPPDEPKASRGGVHVESRYSEGVIVEPEGSGR
mmetsp:Transcript_20586/g.59751  ORF Transcript_20586/g.59751 Transcript_20586/m.59751 type:complete len:276 (-) Transcript_20586:839-1666(-)